MVLILHCNSSDLFSCETSSTAPVQVHPFGKASSCRRKLLRPAVTNVQQPRSTIPHPSRIKTAPLPCTEARLMIFCRAVASANWNLNSEFTSIWNTNFHSLLRRSHQLAFSLFPQTLRNRNSHHPGTDVLYEKCCSSFDQSIKYTKLSVLFTHLVHTNTVGCKDRESVTCFALLFASQFLPRSTRTQLTRSALLCRKRGCSIPPEKPLNAETDGCCSNEFFAVSRFFFHSNGRIFSWHELHAGAPLSGDIRL